LGGYVRKGLLEGVEEWISRDPERDKSLFLREAVRKKLRDEGIPFTETTEVGR
jgi:hypothetical protein